MLSADNRFVFVPDLGPDEIKAYRMEPAAAKLQEPAASTAHVKPGSGPRHFAFHPGNRFAYSVNEMASSVTAISYEAKSGTLTALETVSNLPEDFHGEDNSAEISLDRAGRFLYASNRGHDSITVYAVDSGKGTLTKVQVVATGGKTPRSFALDPTGRFLLAANQDTNNIQVFSVDTKTGKLTAQGTPVAASSPVCLLFALRS